MIQNAGFKVYGPVKDKVYVTGGYQGGMTPNVSGNVISQDSGTYVISPKALASVQGGVTLKALTSVTFASGVGLLGALFMTTGFVMPTFPHEALHFVEGFFGGGGAHH